MGNSISGRSYTEGRPTWCACFHVMVIRPTPRTVLWALCSPTWVPLRVTAREHLSGPRLPERASGAVSRQVYAFAIPKRYPDVQEARSILIKLLFTPRSGMGTEGRGVEPRRRLPNGGPGGTCREGRLVETTGETGDRNVAASSRTSHQEEHQRFTSSGGQWLAFRRRGPSLHTFSGVRKKVSEIYPCGLSRIFLTGGAWTPRSADRISSRYRP